MNPRAIIVLVVLVPVYRDPTPSSGSFRAAPVTFDTTSEPVPSEPSNVVPLRKAAA